MIGYLARRALQAVPVLIGISLVTFILVHLIPGDPIRTILGYRATPEAVATLRAYYGLDQPLPVQYVAFLSHLAHLDLGDSIQLHASVISLITSRLGMTTLLILYASVLSLVLAIPLAAYSAVTADELPDMTIRVLMMIAFGMPAFWVGLILVMVFSLGIHLFPTAGILPGIPGLLASLTLPAVTLALYQAPILVRTLRATMIESLGSDYVVAARARGLPESVVVRRYALRTSLIAMVTVMGVNLGFMLSGTVVVENVFAIPGLGTLLVNAVSARDFPLVEGVALLFGLLVVLVSLVTDLTNAALDPRIRI